MNRTWLKLGSTAAKGASEVTLEEPEDILFTEITEPAPITDATKRALVERFHARYPGLQRLWGGRAMPPDRVMFRITPERVRRWGLE